MAATRFLFFRLSAPRLNIQKITRSWYELPPRQAPLPHMTYSEYLPGRPWRDEIEGVVSAAFGRVLVVVLADETQVLGRYPRAIRPVWGPNVHPAKSFTPISSYEPFPRVYCWDHAAVCAVGDRVHARRILGHFYAKASTVQGDGRRHRAVPHPAFSRIRFEVDSIVHMNWETRQRALLASKPVPDALIRSQPFLNRNPHPDDISKPPIVTKRQLQNSETVDYVFDDPEQRRVPKLAESATGEVSFSVFQSKRLQALSPEGEARLRRTVGPEVAVGDGTLGRRLVASGLRPANVARDPDIL
eukprot:TRINITY_DN9924_c0_g1_i1.p1 TRINITY_DN9924_c0_g1~~TRINITY_DN9924_c0_g1_i1.p1  ORF type:complete len:301 (-),score=25.00 TRINITY_DN9924_c0_g1_i1:148-1050(-)